MDNKLAFDLLYQNATHVCNSKLLICEMKQVYVDTVEDLPSNASPPQGQNVQINCFVRRQSWWR